jgi:LuxR family transcriptional regulator, transcriptional regulator of spore coat protein
MLNIPTTLTVREVEVIRLLARGLSAKQVAAELSIAPRTVEHHIDHARLKTHTRNRVHMIAHAIQEGIIAD